jgi:hypothetical protein
MEKDDSCPFCGGGLRLGKRNNLRVVRCDLCGWVGPTLSIVPRVKLAPQARAIRALHYPFAARKIARQLGVSLD